MDISACFWQTINIGSDNTKTPLQSEQPSEGSPSVRFASVNQEIEPESLDTIPDISGQDKEKLKELSQSLHGTQLQERRMSHFAFEPVSLPASRVRFPISHTSQHAVEYMERRNRHEGVLDRSGFCSGRNSCHMWFPWAAGGSIFIGIEEKILKTDPHALNGTAAGCPTSLHCYIYIPFTLSSFAWSSTDWLIL